MGTRTTDKIGSRVVSALHGRANFGKLQACFRVRWHWRCRKGCWPYRAFIGVFKTVHARHERRQAAESRARMPEEDFQARAVPDGV